MFQIEPKFLILAAFFLLLFGIAAPFLMVIGVLESTFWLNFISFGSSVVGLFLGLIGAAAQYQGRRRDH